MALTNNEKQILGLMTDSGFLKGGIREQVSASDEFARAEIVKFKNVAVENIQQTIIILQGNLEEAQQKLAILNG